MSVLLAPCLATAVAYVRRWRVHPRDPDAEPLPLINRTLAFIRECFASIALLLTWPFGWLLSPRRHGVGGREVVVLIPGFLLNAAALWPLRARLERRGWPVVIGKGLSWPFDLDARARRLEECLAALRALRCPVTLIAFGSGGWVARHYLRRQAPAGIQRLFTLGTMQQGPADGEDGPRWHANGSAVSAVLAGDRLPYELEVVAIYSDFDALVPSLQAYYPGAFNIEVRGIGHLSLLASRKVFELLAENLGSNGRDIRED